MAATFRITTADDGFYQFNYLNGQGESVLVSPEFENKSLLEKAIQEVRVGSLMSQQIAKGKTPGGEFFFMIKDSDGQVVAKSILFDTEMLFDNALHNVRENACLAELSFT
ncbi:DUF1508 domain-containing protein [Haliea sp. E17]|uniref:DUF1508 domain-containing protein n=1 Tax=Haliea sp. E17 TaxID=3401576 RepID=UPI003AB0890D